MRLAVETSSRVRVSYDDGTQEMAQARIEFTYLCEWVRIEPCGTGPGPGEPKHICMTKRYMPCKPADIPRRSESSR